MSINRDRLVEALEDADELIDYDAEVLACNEPFPTLRAVARAVLEAPIVDLPMSNRGVTFKPGRYVLVKLDAEEGGVS
jgi:hypothetical protein